MKQKLFSWSAILLLLLVGGTSYYRFIVLKDYVVEYEISCDPEKQNCFVYCEEDVCEDPEYYAVAQKKAFTLFHQCGTNIEECSLAQVCGVDEGICEIMYCEAGGEEICSEEYLLHEEEI